MRRDGGLVQREQITPTFWAAAAMSDLIQKSASPPVIFLDAVHKIYHSGEGTSTPCAAFRCPSPGENSLPSWRERFGKIHADEHARLSGSSHQRPLRFGRNCRFRIEPETTVRLRNHKLGFVFQSFQSARAHFRA